MFFPLEKYRVFGNSMIPSFKPFDLVLVNKIAYFLKSPRVGDVVIVKNQNLNLIKRIKKVKRKMVFVIGDNEKESTDSRDFGWISKADIIGKVLIRF